VFSLLSPLVGKEGREDVMSRSNEPLGELVSNLIDGLKNAVPEDVKAIMVGAELVPIPRLITMLEGFESYWTSVDDLGARFHAAVQLREERAPMVNAAVAEVNPAILALVGTKSSELTKFGLKPKKKPRALTVEERAAATAKLRATRAARHTMGPRQKAAIHGTVAPATNGEGDGGDRST
jgi:hypothetical protein